MKKVQTGYVVEFYTNTCLVDVKGELIPCFAIKDVVVGDKVTIEKVEDSKQEKAIIVSREKRFSCQEFYTSSSNYTNWQLLSCISLTAN